MRKYLNQIGSVFLSALLLLTQTIFAHALESNFWAERSRAKSEPTLLASLPMSLPPAPYQPLRTPSVQRAPQMKALSGRFASILSALHQLPADLGRIQYAATPASPDRLVIHIQDVHMNPEAQEKISTAIQTLVKKGRVEFMALEGAFPTFSLADFQAYPDQAAVKEAARYLFEKNELSGPVHAALSVGRIPTVIGVDDAPLYESNVRAYVEAEQVKPAVSERLQRQWKDLESAKKSTFNSRLLEFDRQKNEYDAGHLNLGTFIERLAAWAPSVAPTTALFLKAYRLESALNLPAVQAERSALLQSLSSRLSHVESTQLLNASVQYRMGVTDHAEFYAALETLCQRHNLALSQYPNLNDYVRYILLANRIDSDRLYADVEQMVDETYASLIKESVEESLLQRSRQLALEKKLLNFDLTRQEWLTYQRLKTETALPSAFGAFYEAAQQRDDALFNNLMAAMTSRGHSTALLVTGGFHADGIQKKLLEKNVAVVSFVPRLSQIDDSAGPAYLTAFTQAKTPLQELLSGQKLFLSPPPLEGAKETRAKLLISAGSLATGTIQSPKIIGSYLFKGMTLALQRARSGIGLLLTLPNGRHVTANVAIDQRGVISDDSVRPQFSLWPRWRARGVAILAVIMATPAEAAPAVTGFALNLPTVIAMDAASAVVIFAALGFRAWAHHRQIEVTLPDEPERRTYDPLTGRHNVNRAVLQKQIFALTVLAAGPAFYFFASLASVLIAWLVVESMVFISVLVHETGHLRAAGQWTGTARERLSRTLATLHQGGVRGVLKAILGGSAYDNAFVEAPSSSPMTIAQGGLKASHALSDLAGLSVYVFGTASLFLFLIQSSLFPLTLALTFISIGFLLTQAALRPLVAKDEEIATSNVAPKSNRYFLGAEAERTDGPRSKNIFKSANITSPDRLVAAKDNMYAALAAEAIGTGAYKELINDFLTNAYNAFAADNKTNISIVVSVRDHALSLHIKDSGGSTKRKTFRDEEFTRRIKQAGLLLTGTLDEGIALIVPVARPNLLPPDEDGPTLQLRLANLASSFPALLKQEITDRKMGLVEAAPSLSAKQLAASLWINDLEIFNATMAAARKSGPKDMDIAIANSLVAVATNEQGAWSAQIQALAAWHLATLQGLSTSRAVEAASAYLTQRLSGELRRLSRYGSLAGRIVQDDKGQSFVIHVDQTAGKTTLRLEPARWMERQTPWAQRMLSILASAFSAIGISASRNPTPPVISVEFTHPPVDELIEPRENRTLSRDEILKWLSMNEIKVNHHAPESHRSGLLRQMIQAWAGEVAPSLPESSPTQLLINAQNIDLQRWHETELAEALKDTQFRFSEINFPTVIYHEVDASRRPRVDHANASLKNGAVSIFTVFFTAALFAIYLVKIPIAFFSILDERDHIRYALRHGYRLRDETLQTLRGRLNFYRSIYLKFEQPRTDVIGLTNAELVKFLRAPLRRWLYLRFAVPVLIDFTVGALMPLMWTSPGMYLLRSFYLGALAALIGNLLYEDSDFRRARRIEATLQAGRKAVPHGAAAQHQFANSPFNGLWQIIYDALERVTKLQQKVSGSTPALTPALVRAEVRPKKDLQDEERRREEQFAYSPIALSLPSASDALQRWFPEGRPTTARSENTFSPLQAARRLLKRWGAGGGFGGAWFMALLSPSPESSEQHPPSSAQATGFGGTPRSLDGGATGPTGAGTHPESRSVLSQPSRIENSRPRAVSANRPSTRMSAKSSLSSGNDQTEPAIGQAATNPQIQNHLVNGVSPSVGDPSIRNEVANRGILNHVWSFRSMMQAANRLMEWAMALGSRIFASDRHGGRSGNADARNSVTGEFNVDQYDGPTDVSLRGPAIGKEPARSESFAPNPDIPSASRAGQAGSLQLPASASSLFSGSVLAIADGLRPWGERAAVFGRAAAHLLMSAKTDIASLIRSLSRWLFPLVATSGRGSVGANAERRETELQALDDLFANRREISGARANRARFNTAASETVASPKKSTTATSEPTGDQPLSTESLLNETIRRAVLVQTIVAAFALSEDDRLPSEILDSVAEKNADNQFGEDEFAMLFRLVQLMRYAKQTAGTDPAQPYTTDEDTPNPAFSKSDFIQIRNAALIIKKELIARGAKDAKFNDAAYAKQIQRRVLVEMFRDPKFLKHLAHELENIAAAQRKEKNVTQPEKKAPAKPTRGDRRSLDENSSLSAGYQGLAAAVIALTQTRDEAPSEFLTRLLNGGQLSEREELVLAGFLWPATSQDQRQSTASPTADVPLNSTAAGSINFSVPSEIRETALQLRSYLQKSAPAIEHSPFRSRGSIGSLNWFSTDLLIRVSLAVLFASVSALLTPSAVHAEGATVGGAVLGMALPVTSMTRLTTWFRRSLSRVASPARPPRDKPTDAQLEPLAEAILQLTYQHVHLPGGVLVEEVLSDPKILGLGAQQDLDTFMQLGPQQRERVYNLMIAKRSRYFRPHELSLDQARAHTQQLARRLPPTELSIQVGGKDLATFIETGRDNLIENRSMIHQLLRSLEPSKKVYLLTTGNNRWLKEWLATVPEWNRRIELLPMDIHDVIETRESRQFIKMNRLALFLGIYNQIDFANVVIAIPNGLTIDLDGLNGGTVLDVAKFVLLTDFLHGTPIDRIGMDNLEALARIISYQA